MAALAQPVTLEQPSSHPFIRANFDWQIQQQYVLEIHRLIRPFCVALACRQLPYLAILCFDVEGLKVGITQHL